MLGALQATRGAGVIIQVLIQITSTIPGIFRLKLFTHGRNWTRDILFEIEWNTQLRIVGNY